MKNALRPPAATLLFLLTLLFGLFLAPALRAQVLFEEDWEMAELGFPEGWTSPSDDDGNVDPGQACAGQALRMNLWRENENSTFLSPVINRGTAPGKLIISFDYRLADWNDNGALNGMGHVGLNIGGSTVWTRPVGLTTGCERITETISLSQVPLNSDFDLTFVGLWETGDWVFVVDNITVRVIPDNCFSAEPLTQSTTSSLFQVNATSGSFEGATGSLPACIGTNNDDLWYSFVATSRAVDATLVGGDVVLELFSGDCSGLTSLACSDMSQVNELLRYYGTVPGQTYYLRMYSFDGVPRSGPDAAFAIEVGTPILVNDECVSAQRISQSSSTFCSGATTATVQRATESQAACATNSTANDDVWFEFEATTDHFEIFVEGGDLVIELFSGDCGSLNSLDCVDDFFTNETLNYDGATPDQTYYVRVYSFGDTELTGADAAFDICVYTVCPDAPTNLTVSNETATTAVLAHNYPFGESRTFVVVPRGDGPFGTQVFVQSSIQSVATATGLEPGTDYDYFVIPACGGIAVGSEPFRTKNLGDECGDAFSLTQSEATSCGTNLTKGTVENATGSQAGCTGTANDDVWYSFVATSENFSVYLESGDFVVELFAGSCGSLTSLVCEDRLGINETFAYSGATIGQTYYLRVYSFGGTPLTGTAAEFGICVFTTAPTPGNDDCAMATPLTVSPDVNCSAAVAGTTNGASRPEADPVCTDANGRTTVWYKFTATQTAHLVTLSNVNLLNGTEDERSTFEVVSGGCGARTRVQCTGQLLGNNPAPVTVSGLVPDQEYLIRVVPVNPEDAIDFDICVTTDCPALATGLNATDITATTARLSIAEDDGEERDFIVVAAGDVPVFGDASNHVYFTSSLSAFTVANGLMSNTAYDFYVGQGCYPAFAGPFPFTTRPSCGDVIYDTGGPSGNYGHNEDYSVTICPETADQTGGARRVSITFTEFDTEYGFDGTTIYDGENTSAPVITSPELGNDLWSWERASNAGSGDLQGITVFTTNGSGCITLRFTSDGTESLPGFAATINCDLTADIFSTILTTVPAGSGAVTADKGYLSTDSGYMYYVKEGTGSLLALKLGNTQARVPVNGVTLVAGSGATNLGENGCMAPYVTAPDWWVMNRTWDVSPLFAPGSPVGVRFLYTQEDFDAVAMESGFTGLTHENLSFYKINGGDEEDLTAPGNSCHDLVDPANYQEFDPGEYVYTDQTGGALGTTAHQAQFTISSFSGGGGGAGTNFSGALPVEFLTFTGEAGAKFNHLSWTTAREENTAHHRVERSADGQTWTTVGSLPAAGSSNRNLRYAYADEQPLAYAIYRIRTDDLDGSFAYSSLVELHRSSLATDQVGQPFPVPTTDRVTIPYRGQTGGETVVVDVLDGLGKRASRQVVSLTNGEQNIELTLEELPPGLYWLSIRGADRQPHLRRVVKE